MSGPVNGLTPGTSRIEAAETIINGFSVAIDGKSAFKEFTVEGKKLRLTIPLPADPSKVDACTKQYLGRLDSMGKAALAAGLGKKATAIGFEQNANGQLIGLHRFKGKEVKVLNDEYFSKEKDTKKLAKNTDLFNSIKLIWNTKTEEETPPQPQPDPTSQPASTNPITTPPNPQAVEDKKEEEVEEAKSKKAKPKEATEKKEDVKPEERFKEIKDDESTSEEEIYKNF